MSTFRAAPLLRVLKPPYNAAVTQSLLGGGSALMRLGVVATAVSLCLVGLCSAQTSHASIRKNLNVPAEDLSPALRAVATTYGFQVLYPTEIVKDLKTPGASGSLTSQQALTKVLFGTGLSYKYLDANTVTVFSAAAPVGGAARGSEDPSNAAQDGSKGGGGKKPSQDFRVAQVDQGASSNASSVAAAGTSVGKAVGLEEIVVTAQKRGAESVLTVPQSISVIGQDSMTRDVAQSLSDLAAEVPGLALFNNGPNRNLIKIRGVSSSTASEPQDTVGVYLDDLPITNAGGTNNEIGGSPDIDLFDLNRIEVLEGPQGTLYGAGSMGGTVRYITNRPNLETFAADARTTGSDTEHGDASYSGDIMLNAPLVADELALRVVFSGAHDGGYINNRAPLTGPGLNPAAMIPGQNGFNFDNHWTGRAELLFKPTEALSMELLYLHQTYNVNGTGSVLTGAGSVGPVEQLNTINYDVPFDRDRIDLYNLVINYKTPIGLITSSTGYRSRSTLENRDETYFFHILFGPGAPASGLLNLNDYHEVTEELRIASDNTRRFKYVGGLFYSDLSKRFIQDAPYQDIDTYLGAPVFPAFPALLLQGSFPNVYQAIIGQDLKQVAAFTELTYSLTHRLDLTVGGRYFDIRQNYDEAVNPLSVFVAPGAYGRLGSSKETGFTPKATLSLKPKRDSLIYLTAAKGFRPGGFNQPVPNIPTCAAQLAALGVTNSAPTFNPDTVWSYELGGKAALADDRLQVTGAVYHIDWREIQLQQPLACGFAYFNNGGSAKINGAEAGVRAAPSRNLRVVLDLGYTHAYLAANAGTIGFQGDPLPGVPRFTGSVAAEYGVPLGSARGFVGGEFRYISSFNSLTDTSNPLNAVLGSYGILDLHAGATLSDDLTAEVFVKNVTDRLAETGSSFGVFGNYAYVNRPREIGVSFEKQF